MSLASLTPEQDLHFVLCDFGRSGHAYVETDPMQADVSTVVRNLLDGQYNRPVRVLALNIEEGWVRDVSDVIADKVRVVAQHYERQLTSGTRDFIEAHTGPAEHCFAERASFFRVDEMTEVSMGRSLAAIWEPESMILVAYRHGLRASEVCDLASGRTRPGPHARPAPSLSSSGR